LLIQERIKEYENATFYLENLNDLYLEYQLNTLSKNDYIDKVLLISDSLIFGNSFYINNSSYKNTIASGSFSSINSTELKRTISNYYEVLGTKLNDNNKILDDVVEYYIVKTMPKPGGLIAPMIGRIDKKKIEILNNYYKSNGLFENSLLSKDFIIYNQKTIDRVLLYLYLMEVFEEKNKELINLLNTNLKEH
jgi:hypothetical protein